MDQKKKDKAYAQYLCGIITEAQYHEVLGGPQFVDYSRSARAMTTPELSADHDLGGCHAQIVGGVLKLDGKNGSTQVRLNPQQLQSIQHDLGLEMSHGQSAAMHGV